MTKLSVIVAIIATTAPVRYLYSVGNFDMITNLAVEVSFDQEDRASIPEITITRMHLPDKETLEHLLDIRVEKLKRGEKK